MTLPVQTQAVADERGLLTPTYRRYLADLERRVSSSQNDSLAADIAAIATALGSPDGTVANIPEQANSSGLIVGRNGVQVTGRLGQGTVFVELTNPIETAADLAYDPATSGLAAEDVQAAIDELASSSGGVQSIVAGTNITVDNTDPANPVVSATGGGGGGASSEIAASIFRKIVAWWERDETSGTVMVDAHTNGLHGTYSGLTINQTGLAANLGKSVTFPSGNNYAEVPHDAQLCPQGSFACMVWVKRNGTQGNFPKLMWKPNNSKASGNASYVLSQDNFSNGGKASFRVTVGSTNYDALTTSALADATTYMLVGNKVNAEIAIWRNGVKEGTNTNAALASGIGHTTDSLRFGYHGFSGDPWVGSQDQAALFNNYLTPAEIAYLYNSGDGISYATLKAAAGF